MVLMYWRHDLLSTCIIILCAQSILACVQLCMQWSELTLFCALGKWSAKRTTPQHTVCSKVVLFGDHFTFALVHLDEVLAKRFLCIAFRWVMQIFSWCILRIAQYIMMRSRTHVVSILCVSPCTALCKTKKDAERASLFAYCNIWRCIGREVASTLVKVKPFFRFQIHVSFT